jgi:hypothetical protein
MNKDVQEILSDLALDTGWNLNSQFDLVCEYLQNYGDIDHFLATMQEIAQEDCLMMNLLKSKE